MRHVLLAPVPVAVAFVAAVSEISARATGAGTQDEAGPPREQGVFGVVAPQARDVRLADVLVHQDVSGGNHQDLQALAGAPGGFAAVWRDHRDGMMGLYLRRLDATGAGREPEQPIHSAHSGRRRDPAVALRPDGSGAVAWTSVWKARNTVFVRVFDAEGRFTTPDVPLEVPGAADEPGGRVRESGDRFPALAWTEDGRLVAAWNHDGELAAQLLDAKLAAIAPPRALGPCVDPAPFAFVVSGTSVLWGASATSASIADVSGGERRDLGRSFTAACATDDGGFWCAAEDGALVRVDARGAIADAARTFAPLGEGERVTSLARSGPLVGAIVAVTPAPAGRVARPAPFALRCVATDARASAPAVVASAALGSDEATSARVASDARGGFVVAWTASPEGHADVLARTVSFESSDAEGAGAPSLGELRRSNTDEASADQTHARVAAAGERAIVAWQDARDVGPRVFVRRLVDAKLDGDELEIPADDSRDAHDRGGRGLPEVAMRADGSFAVAWREERAGIETLQVQLFRADGTPVAPHAAVDPGMTTTGTMPCALVALSGSRGYVLAWPRPGTAVCARRVEPDGSFAGDPIVLSADPSTKAGVQAGNAALAELDGGRVVCTWDLQTGGREPVTSLHARFLEAGGSALRAQGDDVVLPPSLFGADWDPAVAPGHDGGFVLAWTAGAPNDPGRDVFARSFDARARPNGPFLPISSLSNEQDWPSIVRLDDGSWIVAWEDDLSGHDQSYVRRVLRSRKELGPVVCANELETKSVPDRVLPAIASYQGGWIAAWGDRRRSRGWDVYVRVVGRAFDALPKR